MKFKDYYKILELNPIASKEEIKSSYRKLALKYHPDRNFGDKSSETIFQEIQEAYETLLDESSRAKYDFQYQKYYSNISLKDKVQEEKTKSFWGRYKAVIAILFLIILFVEEYADFFRTSPRQDIEESGNAYHDSKINNVDSSKMGVSDSNSSPYKSSRNLVNKIQELYEDWDVTNYSSGNSPSCYNYTPRFNKSLDNKLEVSVGSNTNVVIKVVDIKNNKCIRYVYIRSGETFEIKNIPEGKYYLKIAFGKDWREKKVDSKCVGKFISNPLYKKGEKVLDFNMVFDGIKKNNGQSYNSYQIPSYSLKLDILTTGFQDQFKSSEISESEFQNEN